jgi:colanic acid biosynthesis glycosyl transferase WcaI
MILNILVLSINYAPEPTGFAPHTAALCEYLANHGHSVTVITGFPFAPYWERWPEYRGKLIKEESINDVNVIHITHFIPKQAGRLFQRLFMEGTFCLLAGLITFLKWRTYWDVIVYIGAQPSIAMLARFIAWFRHKPYVVKITDLAAQAALDVGIINKLFLKNLLEKFEYSAYNHAHGAIVLCKSFEDFLVAKGYQADKVHIIHDSVDLELIRPVPLDGTFRGKIFLSPNDFVILYSGSMGIKQGLTNVAEAARILKNDCPEIKWVIVGDGELKPMFQKLIFDYNLDEQVRLLPLQPESEMAIMFSSADVLLLNQLSKVKDTVIPSKLLTYMAAGKAILAAVNSYSQAAGLIRESKCGIIVPPEDPLALANAAKEMKTNSNSLKEMGQCSRQYAEKHFDRKQIVSAQETFLLEVVKKAKQPFIRA